MELLSGLTDDQTALAGCVGALMVCGLAMTLSSFIGQARDGGRTRPYSAGERNAAKATVEPAPRKAA